MRNDVAEAVADLIPNAKSLGKKLSKSIMKKLVGSDDIDATFVFRRSNTLDAQSLTAEHKNVMKLRKGVLTQKGRNDEALSWSTNVMLPGWVSTQEAINGTGISRAVIDSDDGHVSVFPTAAAQQAFGSMAEWRNSYDNANNSPHFYTLILKTTNT